MNPTYCSIWLLTAVAAMLLVGAVPTFALDLSKPMTFESSGKKIAVEWFVPKEKLTSSIQKLPIVIILHGSGGIDNGGEFFRELAVNLSRHGRVAAIAHYMDRTGHKYADSRDMARYFCTWLATIGDSLTFIQRQPFVDKNNIVLLGHSLGAQLALQQAAKDSRVAAVVDMSGCFVLPTSTITIMPPVLILHGKQDTVVPLSREKALVAVLKRLHSYYEEHIFPEGDHAFNHVDFNELVTDINVFLDARQRTITNDPLLYSPPACCRTGRPAR